MTTYEQIRNRNLLERQEMMKQLGLGVPSTEPTCNKEVNPSASDVRRRRGRPPKKRVFESSDEDYKNEDDDNDDDDDWRKGSRKNKRKRAEKKTTSSMCAIKTITTENGSKGRYPKREATAHPTNYKDPYIPGSDDMLYCADCKCEWEGDCPEHGPLFVIEDTKVVADLLDTSRAKKTAPSIVTVADSKIPEAGRGVWARDYIPARVRFGPYGGKIVSSDVRNAYSWLVRKNGRPHHCVDATEPGISNWMRFVNCARYDGEQNLEAFQYGMEIYYRTLRRIAPHEELLVWYGDDYGRQLGINPDICDAQDEEKWREVRFKCPGCEFSYISPLYLERHKKACRQLKSAEKPGQTYPCPACNFLYSDAEYLHRHKRFCRKMQQYDPSAETRTTKEDPTVEEKAVKADTQRTDSLLEEKNEKEKEDSNLSVKDGQSLNISQTMARRPSSMVTVDLTSEDGITIEKTTENQPEVSPENPPELLPEDPPELLPENPPKVMPENPSKVMPENPPELLPEDPPKVSPEIVFELLPEDRPKVSPKNEFEFLPEDPLKVSPENVFEPLPEDRPKVSPKNQFELLPEDPPKVPPENLPELPPENECDVSKEDLRDILSKVQCYVSNDSQSDVSTEHLYGNSTASVGGTSVGNLRDLSSDDESDVSTVIESEVPTENQLDLLNTTIVAKTELARLKQCHVRLMRIPWFSDVRTAEKPFLCTGCNERFCHEFELAAHVVQHRAETLFVCSKCPKVFSSRLRLMEHVSLHTNNDERDCVKLGSETVKTKAETCRDQSFCVCSDCSSILSVGEDLASHNCEKVVHEGDSSRNLIKGALACLQCEKSFSELQHLMLHIVTHREGKRFASTLRAEEYVTEHQDLQSCLVNGERIYFPKGVKEFSLSHTLTTSVSLKINDKLISTESTIPLYGLVPNADHRCKPERNNTQLAISGSLRSFLKTPRGEFACSQCKAKFSQKGTLIVHRRNHRDQKPFICKLCRKGFLHSGSFREHILKHKAERLPYAL